MLVKGLHANSNSFHHFLNSRAGTHASLAARQRRAPEMMSLIDCMPVQLPIWAQLNILPICYHSGIGAVAALDLSAMDGNAISI
jgi:hypothetical protein